MAHAFVRRADGLVMCRLDGEEKAVIAQVAQEVGELIRTDLELTEEPGPVRRAAGSEDPLDRLEAQFAAREPRTPRDPAVRRLLPDAAEDPALAAEMRRLGQQDLVSAKLGALLRIQRVLDSSGPARSEVVLGPEDARAWLTALTDLRLVLAERLGLRTDQDADTLRMLQQIGEESGLSEQMDRAGADSAPADPDDLSARERERTAGPDLMLAVYDLLSWLQESLVLVQLPVLDDRDPELDADDDADHDAVQDPDRDGRRGGERPDGT